MNRSRLIIATRQSKLALWQAHFLRDHLKAAHPGLDVQLLGMTTDGDRWLSSPLSEVGGKWLFIKALEDALLSGAADIAVHSMKDVPAVLPAEFALPLISFREDVRDALVCAEAGGLDQLPGGSVVGSSSLRRQAMLLAARPDLDIRPVRGNVDTRLAKLDAGDYQALVLAAAGLNRLGLDERISELLPVERCLPAAGQGALGVECRADDAEVIALLAALNEPAVSRCVTAERLVSAGLEADCSQPLGAYAELHGGEIHLRAVLASPDGARVLRAAARGGDPESTGAEVVESLLAQGARALLVDQGG